MDIQVEFEKEIQKREDSIRAIAAQESNLKSSIDSLNQTLEKLNKDIEDRKNKLEGLDDEIKSKNDEYDKHVSSVQDSLDLKEKKIQESQKLLDDSEKEHYGNLSKFNEQKNNFLMMKGELIEELKTMQLNFNNNITHAIEDINAL